EATKQSILSFRGEMDCFALLAMTQREARNDKDPSLRGALATTQSSLPYCREMDCFAEPVIGRAFARPGGTIPE
ncbi:MAG TPA: hypothetical protein VKS24_20790, partial [Bradyrhizobium sp.]|nr:hypothetical protein [Bradyrhizobium sp.]